MSHFYAMNYTLEFLDMYKDVNSWVYLHFNAAHEATGQHAVTLDDDLTWFLQNLLQENTFLFLEGDHGMRYGDWYTSDSAFVEQKLPVMFIIAATKILDKLPSSYTKLMANSFHLSSKVDIRATILDLSHYIYGDTSFIPRKGTSLARFSVPDNVNCTKLGISPWFCAC
jgi:hypothetical protein